VLEREDIHQKLIDQQQYIAQHGNDLPANCDTAADNV
jgi:hypothetical protein